MSDEDVVEEGRKMYENVGMFTDSAETVVRADIIDRAGIEEMRRIATQDIRTSYDLMPEI